MREHRTAGIPSHRGSPECWLDAAVRANLEVIDATLLPECLHGEVVTQAGMASGRADLLAISREGRLTVLELKAGEDIHLPLQALDYWMRIAWHSAAGELDNLFPGNDRLAGGAQTGARGAGDLFSPGHKYDLAILPAGICVERVGSI